MAVGGSGHLQQGCPGTTSNANAEDSKRRVAGDARRHHDPPVSHFSEIDFS